ncbi:MAG: hypothetical protein ACKVYV_14265 [Limisphaerales bacterium]
MRAMKFAVDLTDEDRLAYCRGRIAELETWLSQEEAQPPWRQDSRGILRRRLDVARLRRTLNELLTPRLL